MQVGSLVRSPATSAPIALASLPPTSEADLDSLLAVHDQDDAVYRRLWITDEHVFAPRRNTWKYVSDRVGQYVVLNPEEEWVTTTTIRVRGRDVLEGFVARVRQPDGRVQEYSLSDMVTEVDGDDTLYKLAYPEVVRGTEITEHHRTERTSRPDLTPPLSEDYPLQYPAPVDELRVRYVSPMEWDLRVKNIREGVVPDYIRTQDEETGQQIVEFVRRDVPAYRDEPYSPFFRETADYVELMVTGINMGGARYDPADTWSELGEEFSQYAYRKGGFLTGPVGTALREAGVDRAAPDSVKLVQIVSWVQSNIEVGESSRDDFTRVVREKKGNALMICGLTQAMLDEVGVPSEFLMIHPTSAGFFDTGYVSASQVRIPAVGAEVNGERYVVFPFLEGLPVNYIPEAFQGARAIRITADGFSGFTELPTRDSDSYAVDEAYDIEIDEDGLVRVRETKTLRGIAAYSLRSQFTDLDADEREDEIRELLTYSEGEVGDLDFELVREHEYGTPFEIRIEYTIDNLVTVTPEEVLFQTGGLLSPASLGAFSVDVRERTHPIRIHYDRVTNKAIRVTYPSSWSLTTGLEDVEVENQFGRVTGRYTTGTGSIAADQRIYLRESDAPRTQFADLLDLTGSQSSLYVPTLVFEVR